MTPDFASPMGDLHTHQLDLQAARRAAGLPEVPEAPTPEEIEKMAANFGNLPDSDEYKASPLPTHADPLQGFDITFLGLDHLPIAYTLNLMDEVLHIKRGLFFDDIKYLPTGRIPLPESILVRVEGDFKLTPASRDHVREQTFLRIEFEVLAGDDRPYAEILDVDAENTGRAVPMLELALPIANITVADGIVLGAALSINVPLKGSDDE